MPFPNRYEGPCVGCGVAVPPSAPGATQGYTFPQDGRWVNRCLTCAQPHLATNAVERPVARVAQPPRARIFPDPAKPGSVLVRPTTYLGEIKFADFKVACGRAGAVYFVDDSGRAFNRASENAVPQLVSCLREASIEVELDPRIAKALQERAEVARNAAASADARIARINAELAQRTNPITGRPESLLAFQPTGIVALAEHVPGGFALCDQMGLGKTIQALLALPEDRSAIVITKASIVGEWVRAIKRWLPGRPYALYRGRGGLHSWPTGDVIAIGSFETLPVDPPPECPEGLIAIVDEAHNLKGRGTQRQTNWTHVRNAILARRGAVWALTGTPLVNDLSELWTVLQVAKLGEREFGNKRRFTKAAMESPKEFAERLKNVMLRRRKQDVLADLPPVLPTSIAVEITPDVRAELDDALAKLVDLAVVRAEEIARKDAVALRALTPEAIEEVVAVARANARANVNAAIELAFDGTLRPPFELIARVKSILALAKIKASLVKLDELEEATPASADSTYESPILFFSAHVEPCRLVAQRTGWAALTGETPPEERDRLVTAFQAGQLRGLALTIRAGGEGLNLQRADRILRNDREWTPAANKQARDRAWRFGQTRPVQLIDMVADHALDERILELNREKEALNDQTVEQAVTRLTEPRESLADRLESVLGGTTAAVTEVAQPRRAPRDDAERSAVGWARELDPPPPSNGLLASLVRQFDRHQALTDRQWTALLGARAEATAAGAPHPPRDRRQAWTKRALLTLFGFTSPPAGTRIDGPTRPDLERYRELAVRSDKEGLTGVEWETARRMLTKYHRQIGACP